MERETLKMSLNTKGGDNASCDVKKPLERESCDALNARDKTSRFNRGKSLNDQSHFRTAPSSALVASFAYFAR